MSISPRSFGEVEVIFNSTRPLVDEIIYLFKEAAPLTPRDQSGSIDVAIFSFTSKRLADELLRIGRDYPECQDQGSGQPEHAGVAVLGHPLPGERHQRGIRKSTGPRRSGRQPISKMTRRRKRGRSRRRRRC